MRTLLITLALSAPASAQLDWSRDTIPQLRRLLKEAPTPPTPPAAPVAPAVAQTREVRFVHDGDAFTIQSAPGPVVPVDPALHCRPEVIAAFNEIWARVRHGRVDYEAAFRVDRAGEGHTIVYAPLTHEPFRLPVQIDRARTIAIAHTHPDTADDAPSPGDHASPVPNYVLSRRALYVTVPGTRAHRLLRRDWGSPCR